MSPPTSSDVEAQRHVPHRQDEGGSAAHNTSNPAGQSQTETPSDPRQTSSENPGLDGPPDRGSDTEPRMIGDFDSSANSLWRLYETETSDPDKAHIQTLRDDMERALTFTGLFSVVLTTFVISGLQNLIENQEVKMAYYLEQNVVLLDQISRQINTIAPQFPILPTPAPYPAFEPSASNVRVNAYWFMALVLSLSAAFLATLIQQSARDYMDVFQRYSDPLKSARLRQYLYEGLERWCMPVVEVIPGIIHVSLFLFFVGLVEFTFKNTNTITGITTTIPIVLTSLLYIAATVAQPISPQLPYRTSFSGVIWRVFQKLNGYRYKNGVPDRALNPVMAQRQMQLAMAETEDRGRRDERAIRRLMSNMTDNAEIESLVMAILGSFSDGWGLTVWKNVLSSASDPHPGSTPSTPAPHPLGIHSHAITSHVRTEDTTQVLSVHVGHLLDTYNNRGLFENDTLWRTRTRACVEITALLVIHAGAKLGQFGDMDRMFRLLGAIGEDQREQRIRGASFMEKDHLFVMRWTCLSLVAIRPIMKSNWILHNDAKLASERLGPSDNIGDSEEQTSKRIDKIIEILDKALGCLKGLSGAVTWHEDETDDHVIEILRDHKSQILELEQIDIENAELHLDDSSISSVQRTIDRITHGVITRQLLGIKSDVSDMEPVDLGQFVELFRDPHALLFIYPLQNLRRIRSFAQTLQNILQGQTDRDTLLVQKTIKDLREFGSMSSWSNKPVLRQVWRLQDLRGGGGLGFTVELFFLTLRQLLSTSSSKDSNSALYIGTFRAIISDWRNYRDSLGTQRLLLEMVAPDRGIIFSFLYPNDIVDEFLKFIGNILHGQTGSHINDVVQQLTDVPDYLPRHALSVKILNAIGSS